MTLRRKLFLMVVTTSCILVAMNIAALRLILLPALTDSAFKTANCKVQHGLNVLENRILRMDPPSRKIASMEEIRELLARTDTERNFAPAAAAISFSPPVDLLLLLDKDGKIVLTKSDGPNKIKANAEDLTLPQSFSFRPLDRSTVKTGVIITKNGPLLSVSTPVFGTKKNAPHLGWIVAGRFADETFLEEIQRETGIRFAFLDPAVPAPVPDAAKAFGETTGNPYYFTSSHESRHAYASLPGIGHTPRVAIQASLYGGIPIVPLTGLFKLFSALALSVLILVVAMLLFLNRYVAEPIDVLLGSISKDSPPSSRPPVPPGDELTRLSSGIKRMSEELQARCENLESRLASRNHEMEELNGRLRSMEQNRLRMEESLKTSENRFKRFMNNSSTVAFIKDREGRYTWFNRTFEAFFGVAAGSWLGKTDDDVWPEEIARVNRQSDLTVLSTGRHLEFCTTFPRKGKSTHWIALKFPFTDAGSDRCVGCMAMNITGIKKSEASLKESEERFRTLFEESPVALWEEDFSRVKEYLDLLAGKGITDFGKYFDSTPRELKCCAGLLSVISVNRAAVKLFEAENKQELLGNMRNVLGGKSLPMFKQEILNLSSGERTPIEGSTLTLKGKEINISLKLSIPGEHGKTWSRVFVSIHDMTGILKEKKEKANLEKALQHAQKMQAIGTLAGGIAHNFNNLLMGIQGNISLAMAKVDEESRCRGELSTMEKLVQSGSDLTKQLLGFARGERREGGTANLNEILEKSSAMFGQTRKAIRIHLDPALEIWPVEADISQIEHVLLNLYLNADYAMEGKGSLFLSTANRTLEKEVADAFEITPGRFVEISVRDTGAGMDDETLEQIFEPFFTTRKMGRGTGLGLASSYGIIRIHGGIITAESTPKKGTTFKIYLPASEQFIPKPAKRVAASPGGRETVLLVDDENDVLKVTAQMLKSSGYRVLKAGSGEEAILLYKEHMEKIDLSIIDMIMPDMDGGELYDHLRRLNKDLKVILASGYGLDSTTEGVLERGCSGFIQKPFDMGELSRKVRKILDND